MYDKSEHVLNSYLSFTLSIGHYQVQAEIKSREKALAPLYTQIAHEFADLHDR